MSFTGFVRSFVRSSVRGFAVTPDPAAGGGGGGGGMTLTGDVVSGFGMTPYETINTLDVATSATGQRAASSQEYTIDWSGRRCVEIVIDSDAGTTDGNVGLSDLMGGNNARVLFSGWSVSDVIGVVLNGTDKTSEVFINGVSQGAGDTFSTNVYVLLTTTGAAFSATVVPDAASMTYYANYSASDWYGA